MGVITNGPMANFVPEIAVFELFLFDSREQVYNVLDGPVGQELLDTLSSRSKRVGFCRTWVQKSH